MRFTRCDKCGKEIQDGEDKYTLNFGLCWTLEKSDGKDIHEDYCKDCAEEVRKKLQTEDL